MLPGRDDNLNYLSYIGVSSCTLLDSGKTKPLADLVKFARAMPELKEALKSENISVFDVRVYSKYPKPSIRTLSCWIW